MEYTAVVLAAGRGSRTGLPYNKVFWKMPSGQSVLGCSLQAFYKDPDCAQIVLAIDTEELSDILSILEEEGIDMDKVELAAGGKTRQESVWSALSKAKAPYVMVHDAARPYISDQLLERLKKAVEEKKAVVPAVPVVDTIKIMDEEGKVVSTPVRAHLASVQTPQCFATPLLTDASNRAMSEGFVGTDDAQLVEKYEDVPVWIVEGEMTNRKITNPQDIQSASQNGR